MGDTAPQPSMTAMDDGDRDLKDRLLVDWRLSLELAVEHVDSTDAIDVWEDRFRY